MLMSRWRTEIAGPTETRECNIAVVAGRSLFDAHTS
jgi:hypothetical protein